MGTCESAMYRGTDPVYDAHIGIKSVEKGEKSVLVRSVRLGSYLLPKPQLALWGNTEAPGGPKDNELHKDDLEKKETVMHETF